MKKYFMLILFLLFASNLMAQKIETQQMIISNNASPAFIVYGMSQQDSIVFGADGPVLTASTVSSLPTGYQLLVTVSVTTNALSNGQNLLLSYIKASGFMAEGFDRVAVVLPPATYDLGTTNLTLSVSGIDVVGQVQGRQTKKVNGYTQALDIPLVGANVISENETGTLVQLTDNVLISSINFINVGEGVAYYPDSTELGNTAIMHCRFQSQAVNSMRPGFSYYKGYYKDCVGGDGSWGGGIEDE